ncbi:hypothetical protein E2320_011938, partial [Naja naja]
MSAAVSGKTSRPAGVVAPAQQKHQPAAPAPPSSSASESRAVPEVLVDPRSRRCYSLGRFLGKGGFAKCYEITEAESREAFACKVVPKALLLKAPQKEKMTMEIAIHRSLQHRHVVAFQGFFEDSHFVFVVLELCRRRQLLVVSFLLEKILCFSWCRIGY